MHVSCADLGDLVLAYIFVLDADIFYFCNFLNNFNTLGTNGVILCRQCPISCIEHQLISNPNEIANTLAARYAEALVLKRMLSISSHW